MTKEDVLTGWVAEAHHAHTKVLAPIEIDDIAELDLRGYHPVPPERGACKFKLIRDPDGGQFARVNVISDNWNATFVRVLERLKFSIKVDPVIGEFLVDPNPDVPDDLRMGTLHKWRVTEWRIVRTRIDPRSLKVLQLNDVIKWEDEAGRLAVSSYTWKPYKDQPVAPNVLSALEWAPLG